MQFEEKKKFIIEQVEKVLIEKNKRYGNAALKPINVFYKGTSTNSICIRLDDKISRIKNSDILRKNDLFDLLGYLYLYRISIKKDDKLSFQEEVQMVSSNINLTEKSEPKVSDNKTEMEKFETIFNMISMADDNEIDAYVIVLMNRIIEYFINFNITDFSDLID